MPPSVQSYSEWFASRRSALVRGGLWLAGDEPGRPDPADFDRARLRLLICRLSTYDDVAPSITHRLLLAAARAVPGTYVDLAFLPPEADAALLRRDGIPPWLATGCKRAPADFDVVAVSLSVQQEAANLPAALRDSGLRLDAAGRRADARHPLVILGGHGAGSVPFLHGEAAGPGSGGLVDAVCLGDGVVWLREFLTRFAAARAAGADNTAFLSALARELPGTYVPALYRHDDRGGRLTAIAPLEPGLPLPVVHRQDPPEAWLEDYDGAYVPFTPEEAEETLPLALGCAYRCRFCQTGWLRSDFAAGARRDLAAAARRLKAAMANSDLNLLAADACSVAGLESILDDLRPLFRDVSLKSLSVSSLVRRPEAFRLLRKLAKHEFTFGVEGISARLRAWLGKPARAADLLRIVGALAPGGLRRLKLFFIATGLEEECDLAELKRLLQDLRSRAPGCRLIASFMPLFHAPFTPLQFAPIRDLPAALERDLAGTVRAAGGEFRWSAPPGEIALMNRLCRAGRGATPLFVDFALRRGLRYGAALAPGPARELAQALPADLAAPDAETVFPWSDLRAGAEPRTLWNAFQQAQRDFAAPPEAAPAEARPAPLSSGGAAAGPPAAERIHFWVRVSPAQARHPDHVVVRGLLRNLFAQWPAGVAAYLGAPRLVRPPATAGWVPASAEFRLGTPRPPADPDLDWTAPAGAAEDVWIFGIEWPAPGPAAAVLEALKRGRIKFQTFRRGADRWHVVGRAYRAKTGLVALRESADTVRLYGRQQPHLPGFDLAALPGPAGIVRTLLAPADVPCPVCRGPTYRLVRADAPDSLPACLDCPDR